jgi:hypothetical protein
MTHHVDPDSDVFGNNHVMLIYRLRRVPVAAISCGNLADGHAITAGARLGCVALLPAEIVVIFLVLRA